MTSTDGAHHKFTARGVWRDQHLEVRAEDLDLASLGLIRVIRVGGDVDIDTAPLLEGALDDAATSGPVAVIVDLSQLTFGDSATLNALIRAQKLRFELVVAGPLSAQMQRLFSLAGVEGFFRFAPDIDAAMEQLTAP
ncbi:MULTISPECIES: STAS domain-containing protein [unclassified Streptomyces]|uniref:STAS domain-containing protein n=1 Tax=unclassified Streptomyces TaxID=2593676 RepID=UPI0013BBF169|nr:MULTISPECIES: STAS domain-containing protein [unclassified Streptomyces]MCX5281019.1 STAS domain-containing protein [Streptomyces sp. NBC_00198]NEB27774.1 STAS domain-containing protein [Streptomyces sp. SID14446]WSD75823.1 STAS domain-containing protein [Streptomyces sp. NBC_01558]WSK59234.1 STAS domain-containing protein [Streptomyces sp. NBC_01281]